MASNLACIGLASATREEFNELVSKILPPTSITIPLIAKYLLFTFIMNIITIAIFY